MKQVKFYLGSVMLSYVMKAPVGLIEQITFEILKLYKTKFYFMKIKDFLIYWSSLNKDFQD